MQILCVVLTITAVVGAAMRPDTASAGPAAAPRAGSPAAWIHVDGVVERNTGDAIVLRVGDGRTVAVDLSTMALPAEVVLRPGRPVSVWGRWDGSRLIARGVAVDYAG